jgi:hypothetical protein
MTDDHSSDKSSVGSVAASAAESGRLFRLLADQVLKLFLNKELPVEIKLLLAPLLFVVPMYSLVLVIFLGDLTYCMARNRDFYLLYYLIFLTVSGPLTLAILLAYSLASARFENTRTLELQLQSVTEVRQPRKRRSSAEIGR